MKKLFVFILAFIYLSEASGMGLHLHYCMDKLVSWGLTDRKNSCTSSDHTKDCAGEIKCKDCCKNELKMAKIDNANRDEQSILIKSFPVKASLLFPIIEFHALIFSSLNWVNRIKAPPGKHKVSIFIFNNVFRI